VRCMRSDIPQGPIPYGTISPARWKFRNGVLFMVLYPIWDCLPCGMGSREWGSCLQYFIPYGTIYSTVHNGLQSGILFTRFLSCMGLSVLPEMGILLSTCPVGDYPMKHQRHHLRWLSLGQTQIKRCSCRTKQIRCLG
jgi:hypothetical protein